MNGHSCKISIFVLVLILSTGLSVSIAQQPNPQMQEKLAAIKQATAANQAALRQYKWTESEQITVSSYPRPAQQFSCQYGPDGKVQKTPLGAPPQMPGGGMKGGILESKIEQLKEYMGQVQDLLHQYIPPDPELLEKAYAAGNVAMSPATPGVVQMTIKNYLKTGDALTLSFDEGSKKLTKLDINTYVDAPADAVTVAVQFASLPDGTNYPSQTTINVASKNLTLTTTNSNYQKIGG